MNKAQFQAAYHIISHCGSLKRDDVVSIVYDERTTEVASLFKQIADEAATQVHFVEVPPARQHGVEPPAGVARQMADSDLILGLTWMSMAHTRARAEACAKRSRYLSLPEYSLPLLEDPSVTTDFRSRAPVVRHFADAFTSGSRVRVTTALGTDISLKIDGRVGNYCPGFVTKAGDLGSPPDIEANVSPIETASEGIIVVDGSIPCPEIGLLAVPVKLHVRGGKIVDFESDDSVIAQSARSLFERVGTADAYVLAECGVGLNEKARLTGIMLTDEGANGCMHFGFGSNATVGGKNDVPFHLDFCFRRPTLEIDGVPYILDGEIV